ncbi:MAG: hypothetical protein CVU64_21465 [Deltaproteobacteria bacterium HGW-Deltaproteobacteria-21]|nr:MAG: hypothetical protein CVU64_21465 [Deltaproteobacteria bacterium HGW-Deltaproteobacteria-21]
MGVGMEAKTELVRTFPGELYKESYARTKSTQICLRCGEPVRELDSPSSRLEYHISALCDACREQIIYRCLHGTQELDRS